jgi:hypothetical protein
MFGVMDAGKSTCAFTDSRVSAKGAGAMRHAFGVTAPDGSAVCGVGRGEDGAVADRREDGELAGADDDTDMYRIADPDVVGATLDVTHWPDGNQLLFSTTAALPATFVVGTRPPQFQGARVTPQLLSAMPEDVQDATQEEGGVTVPLYLEADAAYRTLRAALPAQLQQLLPEEATTRGRAPGVFDDTQLWPLLKLDPVTRDSKPPTVFVRPTTDGVYDALAWFTWTRLLDAWQAVPPNSWRAQCLNADPVLCRAVVGIIARARTLVESANRDNYTLAVRLELLMSCVMSLQRVLEQDARDAGWTRLTTELGATELAWPNPEAAMHALRTQAPLYGAAMYVLGAVNTTGVAADLLIRACVWTRECAAYMFTGPSAPAATPAALADSLARRARRRLRRGCRFGTWLLPARAPAQRSACTAWSRR